ncbi:MAG TPA: hypothetical protein VGR31_11540 [Planctomycetota bacterium]|jgi:hypothetical protein|nr:hypothetical protein [Planctomycetota bacterium]
MVTALLLALLTFAPLAPDTAVDGTGWLAKSQAHLYVWPSPGVRVSFQVRTNMLEPAIAALEKDPAVAADPDKSRWVDALRHIEIKCTMDTGTGVVQTDVDLSYEPSDPRGKAASDKMKAGIATLISHAFQGLPLHDASLLHKGGTVVGAEERGDSVIVTVTGKDEKDKSSIHLNKRTELPDSIDGADLAYRMKYVEVVPGKFALSRLDTRTPAGKESHAEYTYQKAGSLSFPSTIRVSEGPQVATFSFVSLKVEAGR